MTVTKQVFVPFKGYVLLALPVDFSTSILELQNDVLEERRADFIKQGNPLDVIGVGEGVDFVKEGDKILVASHARVQKVELEGIDQPYYVLREAEILGKLG